MERMFSTNEDEVAAKFFSACNHGDVDTIKHLLKHEPYAKRLVELTNSDELNAKKIAEKTIYTSTLRGHYTAAKVLLEAGANARVNTGYGTPIYAAVKSGSLDLVRLLIEYRADFQSGKGFSPLFVACIEGRLNILKYLVDLGANLYAFTNPPLVFTACTAGQLEVLKFLMEEMEFNIRHTMSGQDYSRAEGDGKDTLLWCACKSNKLEVASYLVKRGAPITRTIFAKFPVIIKHILQQKIRPVGKSPGGEAEQQYHARFKEIGLAEIPWGVLADYSKRLTKVELRANNLTSLPDKIFQMPVLKVLDVSNNALPELCQEEVEWKCLQLMELDASHNQLSYVPSGLFKMPELANLNLSYNLLGHLPGDPEDASAQTTSGLPNDVEWRCDKLKKLDLSHNRLRALPDTFQDLRRMVALNVAYNHLKEIPQSCSWGCVNLVHLDASHNQLSDLPIGATSYWTQSLERLFLSHNSIIDVSQNITELSHLTTLDLSHNKIRSLPPTSFWSGNRLNKLNLSFNQLNMLTHLPESKAATKGTTPIETPAGGTKLSVIKKLGNKVTAKKSPKLPEVIKEDIDDQPKELPVDLWSNCLQSLYLQSNQLKWLPDYLGKFAALTRLDISGNSEVHELPLTLGRLRNCWELNLNGLKIQNVPHHLLPGVSKGGSTKHLLAYLRAQLRHCVPYNRMKLMAVGLQGRGKTTLLSVLRNPNSPLPANVSTVGVVMAEWVVPPPAYVMKAKKGQVPPRHNIEIEFSVWDMAGQEVYYATHQCFLSRNTLYLVVWNMEEKEKGIDYLRPWLLNIQARAPYSPVIIVGTHLDRIHLQKTHEMKEFYKKKIRDLYDKPGYPRISAIMSVSCTNLEGIKELQERIHNAAIKAVDPDTKEHVIGQLVPSSYVALQQKVIEEVIRCREKEVPPVLNQKEFAALAESIEDGDINDPEELSLAAQFLHDNGILLHYNDHLRGLNNLYFIDPVWLADMLAEVVTVPEKNSFVHNGILKESNVAFIFRDNRRFPSTFFQQYLQLLERFEIALSLGNGNRLIPSMLPYQRPVMNFVDPEPTPRKSSSHDEELYIPKRELRISSVGQSDTDSVSSLPTFSPEGSEKGPRIVDGMEVVDYPVNCIRRRYNMAYVPSGFWSRLISRLIINLKRSGLVEDHSAATQGSPIIYWKRGIVVLHSTGRFLVESISKQAEMSGVGIGGVMLEASAKFMGSVDDRSVGLQGVDIMVWSSCGDFSAMGYVVDQLDSLIDEWFPGLNEYDVEGQWLVQRQVLWKIPKYILDKVQGKPSRGDSQRRQRREAWSLGAEDGEEMGEIVIYPLEKCAAEALIGDTIECTEYNLRIPLSYLVPDLLLTDLPPHLTVDLPQFQFNPQDPATRLGRGGAGAVYKGRYRGKVVAVKEFLTASQAEHTGETVGAHGGYEEDDLITQADAMFLFRDLRQEVTVLAQLSHPNIVALLGVSIRPMCMVIEFAPMGSLFGTLDKTVEQIKQDQADRASVILRMPGGVLGREITMKIAIQVALAIRYLHRHSIVYRDLKSDNVLIWSLDAGEPVNAKLADYGISRFANPGGVKGEEGTPGYLAPEAIRRRGEDQAFDEKVDIFSYAMFIFELLTGQRPYETLTTTQELNQAVIKGERPLVNEGNAEPSFPGLMDLMYDCWKHSSSDRPDADEIVQRICEPGFLCRSHTIRRSRDQPLQKIDTIYARPVLADDLESGRKSYTLWTWARQDQERNFSIIDVRKGVFNLPEKQAPGGRVYAMTATGEVEKRIWIGTADHEIQVYGYKSVGDPQCLWTFTTKDSVLALTTELEGGRVKRVFASLANGTLCIFSRKSISSLEPGPIGDANCIAEACTIKCSDEQFRTEAEDWANPLIMRLGEGQRAAKCMTFVGQDQLWCGCGNTITVVDSNELKVLHHIPVFVRRMALVNELVSAGDRVWGVGRQLSCVMEWDAKTFQLLHIFNANNIDPTNENVITDPKTVEELVDRDRHNSPKAPDTPTDRKQLLSQDSFKVENEPIRLQASSAPFSQRTTRRTLREIKPRERSKNIKFQQEGPRSRIYTTRDLVRRRQQGSTRTTSLVIVDQTLWVARGMGDVLVIDITGTKSHGKVLARLATEDCEKFGNRSYHKLVQVAGEYVVSSQWLEPVDIRGGGRGQGGGGDPSAVAHQSITIWEAWSHKKIEQFMTRRASMLMLEEDEAA